MLYAEKLFIRGKRSDVGRFMAEACYAKKRKNGLLTLKTDWTPVKGIYHGYIMPIEENLNCSGNDNAVFSVHFEQSGDILAEDFKTLSEEYNVDFRLFALGSTRELARNVEVIDGEITLNEFFMLSHDVPSDWYPDIDFGDFQMMTDRTCAWKCEMSPTLSASQAALLKTVAEEQQERYIDKCPCCGEDEMLTLFGKTDGYPSKTAGVYICMACGMYEIEKQNYPLPEWYLFKGKNIDMFLPQAESNG